MAVVIKGSKKSSPYDQHLTGHQVTGVTTHMKVVNHGGGVKEEKLMSSMEEILAKLVVPTKQMHMVEVGGGLTLNLGNFESARLDVRLTVPCTKEELEDAYEWASSWVSDKLATASAAAKGE